MDESETSVGSAKEAAGTCPVGHHTNFDFLGRFPLRLQPPNRWQLHPKCHFGMIAKTPNVANTGSSQFFPHILHNKQMML